MKEYKNLRKVLNQYREELISSYNAEIGNDKHTLQVIIAEHKDHFDINIVGPEEVKFINSGRSSGGFPPPNKIEDWVKRKITTEMPRAKQLSFLIGRKIAEQGTSGNHILEKIINQLFTKYSPLLEEAIEKDAEEDIGELEIKIHTKLNFI